MIAEEIPVEREPVNIRENEHRENGRKEKLIATMLVDKQKEMSTGPTCKTPHVSPRQISLIIAISTFTRMRPKNMPEDSVNVRVQ